MNSKKAITLLVLATLVMSMLPVVSINAAITAPEVWTIAGGVPAAQVADGVESYYGDTLAAVGEGVSPGQNIQVYWDLIQTWDGEAGLLNTSKGLKDGTFEIWFEIPEAINGDHYIWIKDVSTGETVMAETAEVADPGAVMVGASIELDPDAGLATDEVTITGYGYSSEEDIDPATVLISDTTLGVTLNVQLDLSPTTPETNELGTWVASFDVPDYGYDVYEIVADDAAGITNAVPAEFTIGASITLDVEEGPTGTVVEAEGRGFDDAGVDIAAIQLVTTPGHVLVAACTETDADDLAINGAGEFTVSFVIPSWGAGGQVDVDDYEIHIIDAGTGEEAFADFEVTGLPSIESSPDFGIQGETVTVSGVNFTAISGEEVEVFMREIGGANPESLGTTDLDNDGTFEDSFIVPGIDSDTYELYVESADWNVDNEVEAAAGDANFKVGLMIAIMTPSSGPSGADVHITANGFDGPNYDLNFSDIVIFENEAIGGASISNDFFIPTMEPGVYTVSLHDDGSDIFIETEFEVTEKTYVTTTPAVAPVTYNVTIEGWYFPADLESDLEFILYNDTNEWVLDPQVMYDADDNDATPLTQEDAMVIDDDGYFIAYFDVPTEDEISIGTYTLNVTSEDDNVWAQYTFAVVEKTVDIEPRKSTFAIGDTVAFDVVSSFVQDLSFIEIYDPAGDLYWKTEGFADADWVQVGTVQRFPYFSQIASGNTMMLLDDAPLGEWSWIWYENPADGDDQLDNGTFTVVAAEADVIGDQVADLNNQITDLATQLEGVTADFDDVKSDIADVAAIAEQAVTAAQQAAEAVQTVAQTANTAGQAAEAAAEAATAAKDAANGLTTLVYGAIGAALVAALAAIVSLMQISKKIAG